jgi:hypothetical protein
VAMSDDEIDRYLHAVGCEWTISGYWGRYLGLEGTILQVPNAYAHRAALNRLVPVLAPMLPFVRVLWVLVGMPLFALGFAVRWMLAGGWGPRVALPSPVYLHASSDRNLGVVPPAAGRPDVVLVLPFRDGAPPGPWATNRVDLRQITSRTSVVRAALASVRSAWRLLRSADRERVLFTYSAPRWFWVNEALERAAPASLWISNHVDRWAALATSLPATRVTIVQHGNLGHRDSRTGERLVAALPAPLPRIERVFFTNPGAVVDFTAAITGPGPRFEQIAVGLRTEPWPLTAPDACRVLIVGHPSAQRAVASLITQLRRHAGTAVMVAYRPHPTERTPFVLPRVESDWVRWLETGEVVPETDVVVSYGSSVTAELLEATGASLVRWDPNDPASVQETIDVLVALVCHAASAGG